METNVFVFTLFFSFPSLFSWYDIVQVPTNLGSRYSAFFLRERIILRNFTSLKNIQFDLSQFEWFDRYKVTIKECLGGNEIENIQFEFSQIE